MAIILSGTFTSISGEPMAEKVEKVIQGFTKDRGNLVPILQKVQEAEKSLTPEAITEISRFLDISENDVYSVASFYHQFRFSSGSS